MTRISIAFALCLLLAGTGSSTAQTIGYAQAIDRLAASCRGDIAKFCKQVNLGGGRMMQCLDRSPVSAQCKSTGAEVRSLLATRVAARAAVMQVCDADIRRICAGIQPGDGNLMECFYKAKSRMSAQCQRAVLEAG
jgi:hypothetical protein